MLFFVVFLVQTQQVSSKIFNAKTHTLKNGLQIIVISNRTLPSLRVSMLYKVGTADDPIGMIGLSHFLEHMMFKGSRNFPKGQYNTVLDKVGGSYNAMTSFDYTMYYADIPLRYLNLLLEMEADRMCSLLFDDNELESERQVVFEERRMRLENNPFGPISELLQRALHPYHHYGIPPIGYPQHIQAYTSKALKKHYQTWYVPNNAILIVSGNVTLNQVIPIAERYFGKIHSSPVPLRKRVKDPEIQGISHKIQQVNARNSLTVVHRFFQAPGYNGKNSEHYYPLILLSEILGGNEVSDFYEHFVINKKMCVHISSNYDDDCMDPKPFSIEATINPGVSIESFEKELQQYLNHFIKNGVSNHEIEKAKKNMVGHLAFMRDGHKGITTILVALASGHKLENIENFASSIEKVTSTQIHAAAKFVLGKPPYVSLDVLPKDHKQKK